MFFTISTTSCKRQTFGGVHKWSTMHKVLKSCPSKMKMINMWNYENTALSFMTTVAFLQFRDLGKWCMAEKFYWFF